MSSRYGGGFSLYLPPQNAAISQITDEKDTLFLGDIVDNDGSVMDDYESRKRRRFYLSLAVVLTSLFGLSWGLWKQYAADNNSQLQAARALDTLNLNIMGQSEIVSAGCESTLLLLRHCEDYGPDTKHRDKSKHCSYVGYERSHYLATLFGNAPENRWPLPSHLFGLARGRNVKQFETLYQLSKKASVTTRMLNNPGDSELVGEYFGLLQGGAICGRVVVAAWKHAYLAELAVALGCGPENGCPNDWADDDFDQVWQLKYVFHGPGDRPEFKIEEKIKSKNSRDLRHHHHHHHHHRQSVSDDFRWDVYATVTKLGFDPLAFSNLAGDYPDSGAETGGRWRFDEI